MHWITLLLVSLPFQIALAAKEDVLDDYTMRENPCDKWDDKKVDNNEVQYTEQLCCPHVDLDITEDHYCIDCITHRNLFYFLILQLTNVHQ